MKLIRKNSSFCNLRTHNFRNPQLSEFFKSTKNLLMNFANCMLQTSPAKFQPERSNSSSRHKKCSPDDQKKSQKRRRQNTGNALLQCPKCNKTFNRNWLLKGHLRTHSTFWCDFNQFLINNYKFEFKYLKDIDFIFLNLIHNRSLNQNENICNKNFNFKFRFFMVEFQFLQWFYPKKFSQ